MFVAGIVVMSLDGCLTRHDRPGTDFASSADHRFFRESLSTFDCSIAGRKTYEAGRASILKARTEPRLQVILTGHPDRFAADARPGHLEFHNLSLAHALDYLVSRGKERCALLGGSRLYTEACAQGALDELWVTIEPAAFGEGARLFEGRVDFSFTFLGFETLSPDTVLLRYRREKA